ncbi:undecaprenyldiphospho-muramoylpentapeptide beta-N-acetylglucosaminyltransferase [Salinimicrobium oceani]|uniref:UDP-N-acetylglucosamine--N-acetylmuramyl-(pentapeptide) pyrophosphoryl-undecaprenol N-acetylglucosamine transferase n=1 Tax=Salinimicrobium oceani TaxID=2722702 RepID=A0ABX1CUJ8_9FLAO|nr:undecaprenyldiphospho-muramoylpentapeptide beta-N-acetylglucosaminyltransferase [Salinimicrobium oceani]NJW51963.1 undecaprenyldiphospho-muramoylpentapeptide beta-N-acetylglucosaminyltransferase [Salinimicrobium oceani]
MTNQLRVIISGGGTGGHIFPAISIANELKLRYPTCEILFVGAEDRMEMQKVPEAGYKIEGLWISGIQRRLTAKNLLFPVKLVKSLWKARDIIKKFQPDVVIGTGGFASGPLLQMANREHIPTLIQEQNSYPGITNKLLAKGANCICTAYPGMERFFPAEKIVLTGNPVRQDLLDVTSKRGEAQQFFGIDPEKKTVLVLGGSLGARKINQLIEDNLKEFERENVQVLWQTGSLYYEEYSKYAEKENLQIFAFLKRMDLAYAAADIIISRAGAGTVSELCIVGKPVVFIPSPNVAEDHQTKNAMAVAEKDAAVILSESHLEQGFRSIFFPLLASEEKMKSLGKNIKQLEKPFATANIVNEVEKLLKTRR